MLPNGLETGKSRGLRIGIQVLLALLGNIDFIIKGVYLDIKGSTSSPLLVLQLVLLHGQHHHILTVKSHKF